jgi:ferric hydroxamate transport system substrate-binding protein
MLAAAPAAGRFAAAAPRAPRVAALDWAIAETMIALRRDPVAVVAADDWDRFVVEPALPPGIVDIGLEQQINYELLAELRPDLIFTSPFSQDIEPVLRRIAPTERFAVFRPTRVPLECPRELTRTLAQRLHCPVEADEYLRHADALLDGYRRRVQALRPPAVLVVSFIDARHARVYGGDGLFQNVLDRIGVANAWSGATNYWGYATLGIERLAIGGDLRLVILDPIPVDVRPTLAQSPLWLSLPFVRAGRVSVLPPVLMFGAMPAALRFARVLVAALERSTA